MVDSVRFAEQREAKKDENKKHSLRDRDAVDKQAPDLPVFQHALKGNKPDTCELQQTAEPQRPKTTKPADRDTKTRNTNHDINGSRALELCVLYTQKNVETCWIVAPYSNPVHYLWTAKTTTVRRDVIMLDIEVYTKRW